MKETFTREEVVDLLVHLQVASGSKSVFEYTKGRNFGERAENIIKVFETLKVSAMSAVSFGSLLKES